MANHVFHFPDVGEGIHEGQLVEWLISVGDDLKEDTPVCRVETDKAVVEIPSPVTGKVVQLHGDEGELIFVGNPLITFDVEGGASEPVATAEEKSPERGAHLTVVPDTSPVSVSAPAGANLRPQDVPATPRTRALARKLGVDITTIAGTGRSGRVTEEDVERASTLPQGGVHIHQQVAQAVAVEAQAPVLPAAPAVPKPAPKPSITHQTVEGVIETEPMSFLRRKIGEQMRLSTQQLVHVTHVEEVDVTDLYAVYKEAKPLLATEEIKLSPLPYFMKAVVSCLKEFPVFNSSYDLESGEISYKKFYNIGLAVDTSQGLVVPVFQDADRKSIAGLAKEISDKAARARNRELGLDELRGGTFTISNIGSIGGVVATPIINYPEVAILALHAMEDKPSVVNGEICIRKKMFMSISFDHQLIDGADAARFMRKLRSLIENPTLFFTHI